MTSPSAGSTGITEGIPDAMVAEARRQFGRMLHRDRVPDDHAIRESLRAAMVELDCEVAITSPDGDGASGRVVQVALSDLERDNRG